MAILTKSRKKIYVHNQVFYWWIAKRLAYGRILSIANPIKTFIVEIGLDDKNYLKEHVVPKRERPLPQDIGDSPLWEGPGREITPKYIRALILWYLFPEELARERWLDHIRKTNDPKSSVK